MSLQNQFQFSTILAKMLSEALQRQTNGLCRAVITVSHFPDLYVFLSSNRSPGKREEDTSHCAQALKDNIAQLQPKRDMIRRIGLQEARWRERAAIDPIGVTTEIITDVNMALANIYKADTVMHALVSAEFGGFKNIDEDAFLVWLHAQRSTRREPLIPILVCESATAEQNARVKYETDRLPRSEIAAAPGTVKISARRAASATARPLRHAVIVGNNDQLATVPVNNPATDKFCNKDYHLSSDRTSASAVRIGCVHQRLYRTDHWIAFFCEDKDCGSDRIASEVMSAIASDPDVLELARSSVGIRGPYLLKVGAMNE